MTLSVASGYLVPADGQRGWLVRTDSMILWLPQDSPQARQLTQQAQQHTLAEFLQRTVTSLADPGSDLPPFVAIFDRELELVVTIHGPAEVLCIAGGGPAEQLGAAERGWVSAPVHDVQQLAAGSSDSDSPAVLRHGIVRAGGFLLTATPVTGTPLADLLASPAATASPPAAAVPVAVATQTVPAEPEPEMAATRPAQLPATSVPEIGLSLEGILSGERAAVDTPRGELVAAESGPEEPEAPEELEAGGPGAGSIARLHWDNGATLTLHGPVLLGRASQPAVGDQPEVVTPGGDGDTDSLGAAHARLEPGPQGAVITDQGSTNGTFVWDNDEKSWVRLTPHQPYDVDYGTTMAFGERTAILERD